MTPMALDLLRTILVVWGLVVLFIVILFIMSE